MKNYEQYYYIYDNGIRTSSWVSILTRKNVPQSKINISTHLKAIAISAMIHKTVSIYTLYIPPHDLIKVFLELNFIVFFIFLVLIEMKLLMQVITNPSH